MSEGPLFKPLVKAAVLRPYQVAAIESLRAAAGDGKRHLLLVIPTGGGKTLTASEIIRSALSLGNRVLFVVHLRELVDQTARALERRGVSHIGVMRGDDGRVDPSAPVQIASIQTLARREKPEAEIVILDEAHRSIADTYKKHIWDAYPDAIIIGLTATPCRGDGRPLGEQYESLIVGAKYSELIADGFVADPVVIAPRQQPDLSRVRRVAGDWNEAELEQSMKVLVGEIIPTWKQHANGLRTICFACGIEHSRSIVARFVEAGVAAEHLDGTTPGKEREAILARLGRGETTVVSNCAVLTEGFDMPEIRCAILARPTLSLVLHMQTAGRALRPGAVRPIVIDHAGNVGRHGFPHEDRKWSIDGPAVTPPTKNPYRICKACFAYFRVGEKVCPHCGWEVPVVAPELPTEVSGRMAPIAKVDLERDYYQSHVTLARSRGFKPGFAAFKFKEKFERWPPWAWSQETKAAYANDVEWQNRLARREEWKAQKDAAESPKPAAVSTNESEAFTSEPEESFGDWFGRQ